LLLVLQKRRLRQMLPVLQKRRLRQMLLCHQPRLPLIRH
jgi:hypothetical protein